MKYIEQELRDILTQRRPSGSRNEARFAARMVRKYPEYLQEIDEAGNLLFKVGDSETLFVAHLDTVCSGNPEELNILEVGESTVKAVDHQLGADDGAGIYLLMSRMEYDLPGWYLYTRGEECGGVGARHFTENPMLREIKRSICFDRRGTTEVITHQSGQRGASSKFGEAVVDAFNSYMNVDGENPLLYMTSDEGVFTDNLLFFDLIPENINVACAYTFEHSKREVLDYKHLEALKEAVLAIDWESLPTDRNPTDRNPNEIADNFLLGDILIDEINFVLQEEGLNQESLLELAASIAHPDMKTLDFYPRKWSKAQLKWALQSIEEGSPAEIVAEDLLYVLDVTTGEFE